MDLRSESGALTDKCMPKPPPPPEALGYKVLEILHFRNFLALYHNFNQRLSRACIVHLVIKRTNWSYVKTMSCSGSHLGITINIKNTKFVKDLPMIDAQFRFNQCNSFREEYISVFSPYGPVLILWPVVAAILDFRSA